MYTIYKCWFCGGEIKYIHPHLEPKMFDSDGYTIEWTWSLEHEAPEKMLWDCDTLVMALRLEQLEAVQKTIQNHERQIRIGLSDIRTKY